MEQTVVEVLFLLLFLLYLYQRWSQVTTPPQIPPPQLPPPHQRLRFQLFSPHQLPPPRATWQCQVDGGAFVDFSAEISSTLETQYTSYWNGGSPTATFNRDGIPYKADFRTMEQQRDDGLYVTKRTIRRQAPQPPLQHLNSALALAQYMKQPDTWSAMKNQTVAELFALPPGPERDRVCQAFMKTLNSSIKVVDVQRIQNRSLWRQYATKGWDVVSREGPLSQARYERVWLFHGTDEDTVEKIVQQGFNRSFAGRNATAYGKGVYFARDASCKAAHRTMPIELSPFATCQATRVLLNSPEFDLAFCRLVLSNVLQAKYARRATYVPLQGDDRRVLPR